MILANVTDWLCHLANKKEDESLLTPKNKTALKILETATDLFAEQGFDGAKMDDLCARSGANKASIYYHFKDKANLYEVVLTRLFQTIVDQVIAAVEAEQDLVAKLDALIETFAKATYQNKKMPAALMREIASGGTNMPVPARAQMQRLLQCLKQILEAGEQAALFHSANPLTIHFMIIGSICFFNTSEPMRRSIDSDIQVDPSLDQAIVEISTLVRNALLKA